MIAATFGRFRSILAPQVIMAVLALGIGATPISAQSLAAGASHTVVLKPDGTVWAFGNNNNGQLGDNSLINRTSPIQLSGLPTITAVAAGGYHSLALASDGSLYAGAITSMDSLATTQRPIARLLSP